MSTEETHHDPRLEHWLDGACRGLADSAKQRVREEITAHYLDALEHYESMGLPLAEAERNAVQELGSPRRARWRLRKVHLTASEEAVINWKPKGEEGTRTFLLYFMAAVTILSMIGMLLLSVDRVTTVGEAVEMRAFSGIFVPYGVAFPLIVVALLVKMRRAEGVRKLILQITPWLAAMGALTFYNASSGMLRDGLWYWFSNLSLLSSGYFIWLACNVFRFHQKIRNMDLPGDAPPPAGDA